MSPNTTTTTTNSNHSHSHNHHHHTTMPNDTTHHHQQPRLPVTLLSGFLGSGKSTLLKHILMTQRQYKVAVIVNDMAPLNIDAALVEKLSIGGAGAGNQKNNKKMATTASGHEETHNSNSTSGSDSNSANAASSATTSTSTSTTSPPPASLIQRKPQLVKMQNGCICCTLRQDLVEELSNLASQRQFDYVVIESTGISEPMQVAESFVFSQLPELVRLDTCVTVVDVPNFLRDLLQGESISERFQDQEQECDDSVREEGQASHVSALLVDQVEFANVILLNKTDLVEKKAHIDKVRAMVQKLNPHAKIYETQYSKVELSNILNTNLFNMDKAETTSGWLESLRAEQEGKSLKSELEEYGVSSFIYRRRKPFNPIKLHELCSKGYFSKSHEHALARSKGFLWIAGSEDFSDVCYEWEQSGSHLVIRPNGHFFASMDEEQWNQEVPDELKDQIKQDWEGKYGDRRQELVFIGYQDMNQEEICRLLDDCLLSDEDFSKGVDYWSTLFPSDSIPEEFFMEDDDDEEEEEGEVEYVITESDDDEDEDEQQHKKRRVE